MNTLPIELSYFEQALIAANNARSRRKITFFGKTLLIAIVLLLSAASIPGRAAIESTMTSDGLLNVVNQDRRAHSLPPLRANQKLELAARAKALDILKNDYFNHTSPMGLKPWDFIRNAGFPYSFAGENLAINYTSSYELEKDFLASPSHRSNLLSPLFSEIGIAVVHGEYQGKQSVVTVQIFASPAIPLARQ